MKNAFSIHLPVYILAALMIAFPPRSAADNAGLSKSLQAVVEADTVCNIWVFFKDRPGRSDAVRVAPQAASRRQRAGFRASDGDRPIDRQYINRIERRGASLRREFPWGNAASFSVHSSQLNEIAALPFVELVSPVAVFVRKNPEYAGVGGLGRTASSSTGAGYAWHSDMVNIPATHEYLKAKGHPYPGSGVRMAFFDAGFRFEHPAYSRMKDSGSVVAQRDFVDDGMTDYDLNEAASDTLHPFHKYYLGDRHGVMTLGLVAAYLPEAYIGAAWGARFILARTEDNSVELKIEEDNWAAAVIWAEELGADIISSSLGYREFDDPDANYAYRDMDGKTAIVSIAAKGAVERGVIVVNSIGNEGSAGGSLKAPADVDGVVAVGAVDRNGNIAPYSSSGPTFDGRIKPDLSAPGSSVPVLDPYPLGSDSYNTASGTSFAAPMVTGIFAMMLQANPGISAEEARERLYGSCNFTRGQTGRDNRRGHGMPDALKAVMNRNDVFVRITDSSKNVLAGAKVLDENGNVYEVGESGYMLAEAISSAPHKFVIMFREKEVGVFTAGELPFTDDISVDTERDGGLRLFPTMVRKDSQVKGVYMFAGLDRSVPAAVSIYALNGRIIHGPEELRIAADGTAVFTWHHRSGKSKVAAGMYLITVRHGYGLISGRVMVAD